jgi:hypothetical protein
MPCVVTDEDMTLLQWGLSTNTTHYGDRR